jgi:hypothetical protein
MKKFKRVLSSLLAAALTVSAVAVANVSSVFADVTVTSESTSVLDMTDLDYTVSYDSADASLNETFNDGAVQISATVDSDSYGIKNAQKSTINEHSYTKQLCLNKQNGTTTTNRTLKIVLDSTYNIYVDVCASGSRTYTLLKDDVTTTMGSYVASSSTATLKFANVPSGTYYLTATNTWYVGGIGLKSATTYPGNISYTLNSSEYGTASVTVADTELSAGSSVDASANDTVVITATAQEGYEATVSVAGVTVDLSNNSYSFNVNGDAAIVVTFEKSQEICDYNIGKEDSLEKMTNIEFSGHYSITQPTKTTIYLADGKTKTTFNKAAFPSGSSATVTVNMVAGDTVGFYYTAADGSSFTGDSPSAKAGALQIKSGDTVVATDSNTANKEPDRAYYFSYTAETTGTYVVNTTKNRFVVFGIDYTTASTESKFTYVGSVLDGTNLYVIGKVASSDLDSLEAVGFGLAKSEENAANAADFSTTTVYDKVTVGNKEFAESGYYFTGYKITDVSDGTVWAAAFSNDGTTNVFANAVNATAAE